MVPTKVACYGMIHLGSDSTSEELVFYTQDPTLYMMGTVSATTAGEQCSSRLLFLHRAFPEDQVCACFQNLV